MKVCLQQPGNGLHSNVPAKKRQDYLENLGSWVQLLATAPMPIVASWQHFDPLLAGINPTWIAEKVPLLDGPAAHTLLSQYDASGENPWIGHARAQFELGLRGNLRGAFTSEYDISRKSIMGAAGNVLFAVAPDTIAYSECVDPLDAKGMGKLKDIPALRYHDYTVVPMWGAEDIDLAFKAWQRFPSDVAKRDTLIAAIRKVGDDPSDHIAVLYLDIEAPLVGSNFGMKIWEMFFRLIAENDLSSIFISFDEAAKVWRRKADERLAMQGRDNAQRLFARRLGGKWTAFAPQLDHVAAVARLIPPTSAKEHMAASLFTTSDVLSALHRKIEGDISLGAEGGSVIIGYDPTIIEVAKIAMEAWRKSGHFTRDEAVVRALRATPLSKFEAGEAGQWFARRAADVIENFTA
jgi:hypothetical protein